MMFVTGGKTESNRSNTKGNKLIVEYMVNTIVFSRASDLRLEMSLSSDN